MKKEEYIPVNRLCAEYHVEIQFFQELSDHELLSLKVVEESPCIHPEDLVKFEKIMRMRDELNVNLEGIDIIFNLLQKIETLQNRVNNLNNLLLISGDME